MYEIFKQISYLIRAVLAYWVIDNSPIAQSEYFNELIWQVIPTFTILMIISYFITGRFYKRGRDEPALGAFIYFVVYCVLLAIMWVGLLIMTALAVIPI